MEESCVRSDRHLDMNDNHSRQSRSSDDNAHSLQIILVVILTLLTCRMIDPHVTLLL